MSECLCTQCAGLGTLVPSYLEAPDNEDSVGLCESCNDEEAYDELIGGRFEGLCTLCYDEALYEMHQEDLAERAQDREWFPEDYDYDHGGY